MKSQFLEKAALTGTIGLMLLGGLAIGVAVFTAINHDGSSSATLQIPISSTSAVPTAAPQPLAPSSVAQPTSINWQPSFEAALEQSKTSGKPVMVDFKAKWVRPVPHDGRGDLPRCQSYRRITGFCDGAGGCRRTS